MIIVASTRGGVPRVYSFGQEALLLAKGADLRAKDAAGLTALDTAMQSADMEVVRFLAEKGLDPNEALPASVGPCTRDYVHPLLST